MQQHGEIQPRIDEGIDRKTLNTLRKRFMAVNATRLRRVLQALPSRQYNVLQLLPLLFDVNYPLLPGLSHVRPLAACTALSRTAVVCKSLKA